MSVYVRYRGRTGDRWGEVEGTRVFDLTAAPWEPHSRAETELSTDALDLLAPVAPGKIVLVGLNYRAHVAESKSATAVPEEPVIFIKPTSTLLGPGDSIVKPRGVERVDYEAELAVVIGRQLTRPTLDQARDGIFGATCLNDVTARPLQRKDVQWTRAKGFDTFCPVGPRLVTGMALQNLSVQSLVNGDLRQNGHTRDQIWPVAELVRFIAGVMTLYPGDLISTGTPEGVGPLQAGDEVEIRIEDIGRLINPVRDQDLYEHSPQTQT